MLPRWAGRPLTFRIGGDPLRCSAWSPVPRSLRSLTRRRPRHAGAVTDLLGDATLLRCADFARAESEGATIVQGIHSHGYRAYTAADLEGHHWTFAQARPTML